MLRVRSEPLERSLTCAYAVVEALTMVSDSSPMLSSTEPPLAWPCRATSASAAAAMMIFSKLSAMKSAAMAQKSQTFASTRPSAKDLAMANASAWATERPLTMNAPLPSAHPPRALV